MTHPLLRNRACLVALACLIGPAALAREQPAGLEIEPARISLDSFANRQQVAVTLIQADGSLRDVTSQAQFAIEPREIADVSREGLIRARSKGEARLTASAAGHLVSRTILVRETPQVRPTSFRLDVAPVLSKSGCNMGACHGNLNGKGGFRLSLRGEDPAFDLLAMTRDSLGRRIDLNHPESSLILLKPLGQVAHEGGPRIAAGSTDALAIQDWIKAGAVDDAATAPKLTRLNVFPAERYLASGSAGQQLLVTAEFADGSRRDVTRQAAYDLSDPTRATVSPEGRVEPAGPGEIVVAVRFLEGRGVSRLAFLPDRPGFVPSEIVADNPIDRAVFTKLNALKIHASKPADDVVFLRRAYLDAIGLLPSADEARAFLADSDPSKREKLIDRLIARPEFADFWALKWADLLRNEEKTMGPKGVWSYQRWLRDRIAADVPMDRFAREMVSTLGSTWENPAANFHRTNRDPQAAAESFSQVFLGVRLQCARCHNHPFDVWTQDDYFGLAAFFANVKRREVDNMPTDTFDSHEITGDEVIFLEGKPGMIQPRSGRKLAPKPPGGPVPGLKTDSALNELAAWLSAENPQFTRNLANRVWFHLMGRGVVEPVDDFRDSNPPSNPALMDALAAEFRRNGMRLKPLVAQIMKSKVYQLDSTPDPTNAADEANFARYPVRLLTSEVLLDAISQALDRPERFPNTPRRTRAVQLPGAGGGNTFLKSFGKPDRLLTCECERSESTTLSQAFQLINGDIVRRKLTAEDNRIGRLLNAGRPDHEILADLYFAALNRAPREEESHAHLSHVSKASDRRSAWEDVAWAILNSKEFLLRH